MTSQETRNCQNCKQKFEIEDADFNFYKKMEVPPPTWCPICRFKRRGIFWNQHGLFRNKDFQTGKDILSTYPAESGLKIIERDRWWSDEFDASAFSLEYNLGKTFFEQFKELMYAVPWPSKSVQMMKNSDYSDQATGLKNCYLCFNGNWTEDCLYGVDFNSMKSSMDFFMAAESELCYEITSLGNGYQNFFSDKCNSCRNVWFCKNCSGCSDCFGCVNLRDKQYHFFNQQLSKEEYEKRISELNLGSASSIEALRKKSLEFWQTHPVKYMHGKKNSNVIGDYVFNSKNVKYSFEINDGENVKYTQNAVGAVRDCMDYSNWGAHAEMMYEVAVCGIDALNLKFCYECWPACRDLEYSIGCHSSANLFGCVGLRNKQYCVLNKQYSKEEYESLIKKIKEDMNANPYTDAFGRVYGYGEFFPPEFSPFSYNETVPLEYFPARKEEVIRQGFSWREMPKREYEVTVNASDLPDHIKDVSDSILKETVSCSHCKRAFRIVPEELQFLRRFQIPLPRNCFNCRHGRRNGVRNPPEWYPRQCMCRQPHASHKDGQCQVEFETTYAPNQPEIVYCEQCYQQEIV